MAVPARPAGGAVLDSAWGQVAHDTAVAQDIQAGEAIVGFPGGTAVSNATTITFPRPFASTPNVVAQVGGAATAGVNYACGINSISPTGFVVQLREVRETATSGNKAINWIAYGPRS